MEGQPKFRAKSKGRNPVLPCAHGCCPRQVSGPGMRKGAYPLGDHRCCFWLVWLKSRAIPGFAGGSIIYQGHLFSKKGTSADPFDPKRLRGLFPMHVTFAFLDKRSSYTGVIRLEQNRGRGLFESGSLRSLGVASAFFSGILFF